MDKELRAKSGLQHNESDFCLRYFPRHDFASFRQELDYTEGELINLFPLGVRNIDSQFNQTKRIIAVGFWALDIVFVALCHRVPLIQRVFSNKWGMFAFKAACVLAPAVGYVQLEAMAAKEHQLRLFRMVEDDYRSYKGSGDLLKLNPNAKIFDIIWEQS